MTSASLGYAGAMEIESRLQIQKKDYRAAVSAANDGLDAARRALDIAQELPKDSRAIAPVFQSKEALSSLLLQKIRAQAANGSTAAASRTLNEYLPLVREVEAHPHYFLNMAMSRYQDKNFQRAESYFRMADLAAETLGYEPLSFFRVDCAKGLIGSIEGQRDWPRALDELSRLDALAGDDETLQYRIRLRFERSYAYLRNNVQLPQAQILLNELAEKAADGMFRAHALGLQGVALWKSRGSQVQATELLSEAVGIYMNPVYADEASSGLNADVRDLVAQTYLEAIFGMPETDRAQSLAVAQWFNDSSVQSALTDAAVRFAVKTPGLSELVRRDQDLRLEVKTLLAGASSGLDAPLESHINSLNLLRAQLQGEIKQRFPDYDNLVAPKPLSPAAVARQLAADETILMLLPTDEQVFIWALTPDGKVHTAQAKLTATQLHKLVADVRSTLDFSDPQGRLKPFDRNAAHTLYAELVAPVQAALSSSKHLIVAAGGVLGQIPFSLLITQPAAGTAAPAQWLIDQTAISHVPSLSAWMAVKQLAGTAQAAEAMAGWGDPQFALASPAALPAHSSVRNIARTRSSLYASIPPLPETRDELLAIANVLQADPNTDIHLGADATKSSVLRANFSGVLNNKRVVVFATHGLMAGDLPGLTQPALALAATENSATSALDALLTLDDVLSLKLNADWVILSACNSAAADGKAQEALSGLARGFFYAGGRSLLVTHWAVESMSAMLLTTKTMQNQATQKGQRKAESLRQAIRSVLGDPRYSHPAYWAPYTVVGDGN